MENNLKYYIQLVENAVEVTRESRDNAERCRKYYDGDQLTLEEIKELKKRGQPIVIKNKIKQAVNGILGVIEQGETQPRAWARTPKDADSADVATDVLQYSADVSKLERKKMRCAKELLTSGTTAIACDLDSNLKPILFNIAEDEFIYDPYSRELDFSDASYLGLAKWRNEDAVKAAYPEAAKEIESASNLNSSGFSSQFEDRPDGIIWKDDKRRRILVCELYNLEGGKWQRIVFCHSAILLKEESQWVDDDGKTFCPIKALSAYITSDNKRYGFVYDMLSLQDEVNKRSSKALFHASARQIQAVDDWADQLADPTSASMEANRADGVIPRGWRVVPQDDMANSQLGMLQEAKAELERIGAAPAILGRQSSDASGRSILARQQAGLTELTPILKPFEDFEVDIYRTMWHMIKQFWKEPQYIRVTDDEDAPKYVMINEPQYGAPSVGVDEFGNPALKQNILGYKNNIADMDIDIKIKVQPQTANMMEEQLQELIKLAGSPQYAGKVPFEILLELSSIRNKRFIIDKLKKAGEEQSQQQAQMQQEAQQLAKAKAQSDIQETNSRAGLNNAKAQSEEFKTMASIIPMSHAADVSGEQNMMQQDAAVSGEIMPPMYRA